MPVITKAIKTRIEKDLNGDTVKTTEEEEFGEQWVRANNFRMPKEPKFLTSEWFQWHSIKNTLLNFDLEGDESILFAIGKASNDGECYSSRFEEEEIRTEYDQELLEELELEEKNEVEEENIITRLTDCVVRCFWTATASVFLNCMFGAYIIFQT